MTTAISGHCGNCGIATNSLPCWSCELERRIQQQMYPCATCDQPEVAHASTCAMHPDNWGKEAIPSDIPGTATLSRKRVTP